jgi:DegV family protein with EDD domain
VTVARDAAIAAERATAGSQDLTDFLRLLHAEAERVLATTPDLMPVLKKAGVVDAGGKAFVLMVEGFLRLVNGDPILPADESIGVETLPAALSEIVRERDFQYCTEVLVRGDSLPAANNVRAAMHDFGGSVVVAIADDLLKIHVHTDTPDEVFSFAERWGSVDSRKAEDMRAQHRQLGHIAQRRVAIVTDSSNDLSDATLDRLGIITVPHQVVFGDEVFRDRIDLKPDEFYRKLAESSQLPTTSQPAPAEFVRALRAAREEASEVVTLLVSSALSGTFTSAQTAVQMAGINGVSVFDSRTTSLGLGMLALRASELAEQGWNAGQIVEEIARVRQTSGGFLTVARYENLLRSGRVSRGKAWLGELLQIRPILEMSSEGTVLLVDKVWGKDQLIPRILELIDSRLQPRPQRIRFGVVHADAPEEAARVAEAIRAAFNPLDVLVGPATGVIGTHVGEGAWALFYQVEDGTPEMNIG